MGWGRILRLGIFALAVLWLTRNVRPIAPGEQAIVTQFGAVVRVQQAGVVIAWPPPFQHVVVLPAGQRLLLQNQPADADELNESTSVLTDDGRLVRVQARLRWRQAGPGAAPALRALFEAAAVDVAAHHTLADFVPGDTRTQGGATREIADRLTGALDNLAQGAPGTGIRMTAADITASLPAGARADAAIAEAAAAAASLAAARQEATRQLQQTDRDRARLFTEAHAEAAERVAAARSGTATLTALDARMNPATRPALLADLYRERIAGILRQAGSVSTVDPKSVSKVVIPDPTP